MQSDGSFALDLDQRIDCSRSGGPVQDAGRTYPGTFTLDGHRIDFTSPRVGDEPLRFQGTELGGLVSVVIVDPGISASGQLRPFFERERPS